ncbi:hypothetical protein C9890_0278, partial [Perkinsus sp. BL_2016]
SSGRSLRSRRRRRACRRARRKPDVHLPLGRTGMARRPPAARPRWHRRRSLQRTPLRGHRRRSPPRHLAAYDHPPAPVFALHSHRHRLRRLASGARRTRPHRRPNNLPGFRPLRPGPRTGNVPRMRRRHAPPSQPSRPRRIAPRTTQRRQSPRSRGPPRSRPTPRHPPRSRSPRPLPT